MSSLALSRSFLAAMVFTLASSAIAQDAVRSEVTAFNGVLVGITTIARIDRREFYSPMLETESSDLYAGRIDNDGAAGALFLKGAAYYRGRAHLYDRAAFLNGELAAFKRGPVEVRGCRPSPGDRPDCLWSEEFTVTVTLDEVARHANNGTLEVELSGGPTPETTRLTMPVTYLHAVIEVAERR